MRRKGLTPPSIKLFVSFIKCMLVWTERWKWEFNGHQASKTCSRNILSGRTSDFHLYFYFSQPLNWSALPRPWVGGGGYTYKRKRRAGRYILFYTIHFNMPSTPSTADLKGALHENVTCPFYQISRCTAEYLVVRSMTIWSKECSTGFMIYMYK
jgi:hypothetical protein